MLQLPCSEDDDSGFVDLLDRLIVGTCGTVKLQAFYVVNIDNWFGAKWLGFNRKVLGAAGEYVRESSAPRLVPPFTPARVRSCRRYLLSSPTVHRFERAQLHVWQPSEDNARRSVKHVLGGHGAFWWSGATRVNGRGCIMAYLPGPAGHVGWYAGFKRSVETASGGASTTWNPGELRGISRSELQSLLDVARWLPSPRA